MKPTLIPVHSRPDRQTLISLLDRLNLSIAQHPLIMIGNKPIVGDIKGLQSNSETLKNMMSEIGWVKVDNGQEGWKPKFAKVAKKDVTEVERAMLDAKK
jgi:hypothetical protein